MSALGDYRAALAARLLPVAPPGVAVTLSPLANPPMILVDLVTGDGFQGVGTWVCSVPIKCVHGPPSDERTVAALEEMQEAVIGALGNAPWTWRDYRPTDDITLPMVELIYPALIPNPHC